MIKCAFCENEFSDHTGSGRNKVYCTPECRGRALYSRKKAKVIPYEPPKNISNGCHKCGITFLDTRKQKYCSRTCYLNRNITVSPSGDKMLRCSTCQKIKPLTGEFFHRNKKNPSLGFSCHCKICSAKKNKQWRVSDLLKVARLRAESTKRNANTIKQYREKVKPLRREAEKTRRLTDPAFALKNRIRSLMYHSLRHVKAGRKWQDLVGYSVDDLRRHIEKKFTAGMSWALFLAGEIHIDHEIPVTAFNFKNPDDYDFKRCWALKNLRPMWALDNIKKGDRIDKPFQPSLLLIRGARCQHP